MSRFFKVPEGTTQNPVIGIIAAKNNISRATVLGIYSTLCELMQPGNWKIRGRDDAIEIISFSLAEDANKVAETLAALEGRGLIDGGGIVGLEQRTSDAVRKADWRARKKALEDAARDSHGTVPGQAQDSPRDVSQLDQTRPERLDQKDPLTPRTPIGGQGSGSFSGVGDVVGRLVVGKGRRFDIEQHLHDDDYLDIRRNAPGWDLKNLFEKYNAWQDGKEPPRTPRAAFKAWLKNFTKGKAP